MRSVTMHRSPARRSRSPLANAARPHLREHDARLARDMAGRWQDPAAASRRAFALLVAGLLGAWLVAGWLLASRSELWHEPAMPLLRQTAQSTPSVRGGAAPDARRTMAADIGSDSEGTRVTLEAGAVPRGPRP